EDGSCERASLPRRRDRRFVHLEPLSQHLVGVLAKERCPLCRLQPQRLRLERDALHPQGPQDSVLSPALALFSTTQSARRFAAKTERRVDALPLGSASYSSCQPNCIPPRWLNDRECPTRAY